MRWRKRGLVFAPTGDLWWARRYAVLPTADVVENGLIRVYFASLDDQWLGRVGYVDLDGDDPRRVLFVAPEPVLDLGELGTFADSGVTPSCVVDHDGKKYLYYFGWQRMARVPYMYFSSRAVSYDGGRTFAETSPVPLLDRTPEDPLSRSVPCVRVENGLFRMWYCSCTHWSVEDGQVRYNNVIRYAESADGQVWTAKDEPVMALLDSGDYSIGRPWVVRDSEQYRMWYSIRSVTQPYRIGYAESSDGVTWTRRDDDVGIARSEDGWDSEMICYPCVIDVRGRRYMFYNGNRHGSTGFGYALWQDGG